MKTALKTDWGSDHKPKFIIQNVPFGASILTDKIDLSALTAEDIYHSSVEIQPSGTGLGTLFHGES